MQRGRSATGVAGGQGPAAAARGNGLAQDRANKNCASNTMFGGTAFRAGRYAFKNAAMNQAMRKMRISKLSTVVSTSGSSIIA